MQYFKNPDITTNLYDIFLSTYGKLPENIDEVQIYFANLFYVEFFLGMKPDYNYHPSEYYGNRRGRLYDHKGALRDTELPRSQPPLVCPPPRLVTIRLEINVTSQIGREGRDSIIENIQSALTVIVIVLN